MDCRVLASFLHEPDGSCYTSHGNDCVIVGWVQPTGLTPFAVGCTHPTNGSQVPAAV